MLFINCIVGIQCQSSHVSHTKRVSKHLFRKVEDSFLFIDGFFSVYARGVK